MEKKTILEVHNVSKSFPGVRALKGVDLDLYAGEVHAIVGENGAGKSTLMKVLTGVYQRDEGTYLMEGEPVEFGSVHQSLASGISCIYQELTIVPMIDVARNLFLGNLPQKNGLVDYKRLYAEAQEVLDTLELDVSPKTPAKDLSIAQHQMIEIGRAITRKSKVIIMDEPTSSLTSKETEVLFRVIRTLRSQGVGIFYISHKLEEILEISDRISVFRDGEHISTFPNDDSVTQEKIVAQMIGREIGNYFNKQPAKIGEVVLQARGLTRKGYFENISFEVHRGEVLGFFGLVGAGRSEVMTSLFGAERLHAGEIYIDGIKTPIHSPRSAIKKGLGLVPEDRKAQGLVLRLSIRINELLVKIREISTFGVIHAKKAEELAEMYRQKLAIKTPSLSKIVAELSGGNQQKVAIAKWLMLSPRVLILDEPTRGVDVGAKSEIYKLISRLAQEGVAIIVISSELPEILGISDRIITMHEGHQTGELLTKDTCSQEVMEYALGGKSR